MQYAGSLLRSCALVLVSSLAGTDRAAAATLTLSNGDVLHGTIVDRTDSQLRLRHPTLGTLDVPRSAVAAVVDDAPPAPVTPAGVDLPAVATDDGLLGLGLLRGWKRKLEFGLNGADGRHNNLKLHLGFAGDYEDREERWALKSLYAYNETEGVTAENDLYAEMTRDWLRPGSPWFSFASARYDWDQFQAWDHRVAASAGIGYQFLNTEVWSLSGRSGLGANQTFGEGHDEFTPEVSLGIDGRWRISGGESLRFRSTFYPNIEQWGEMRNISGLDWEMRMATDIDLSLKLGIANEYDSLADGEAGSNDFTYYGGLAWGF